MQLQSQPLPSNLKESQNRESLQRSTVQNSDLMPASEGFHVFLLLLHVSACPSSGQLAADGVVEDQY